MNQLGVAFVLGKREILYLIINLEKHAQLEKLTQVHAVDSLIHFTLLFPHLNWFTS